MSDAAFITLKEVRRLMRKDRKTVYRAFQRRGIKSEGRSVSLAELREKWPTLHRAIQVAATAIQCPRCSGPVVCECAACDFAFRPSSIDTGA